MKKNIIDRTMNHDLIAGRESRKPASFDNVFDPIDWWISSCHLLQVIELVNPPFSCGKFDPNESDFFWRYPDIWILKTQTFNGYIRNPSHILWLIIYINYVTSFNPILSISSPFVQINCSGNFEPATFSESAFGQSLPPQNQHVSTCFHLK